MATKTYCQPGDVMLLNIILTGHAGADDCRKSGNIGVDDTAGFKGIFVLGLDSLFQPISVISGRCFYSR